MPLPPVLGRHWLIELQDCEVTTLTAVNAVAKIMEGAVAASGATQVESRFHQFNPYGVSGVIVIMESHFTIHTWPEYAYAAVDIFTCGDLINTEKAVEFLQQAFGSKQVSTQLIERGIR
ncbi:MAG: adenosylmethionine decarboxylase [Saprospiraceae bacterium]|nr:adenosylmethionine decarboxylase [Saprospiraceae bacterium]